MTGLISKDLDQAINDINRLREPRVVAAPLLSREQKSQSRRID